MAVTSQSIWATHQFVQETKIGLENPQRKVGQKKDQYLAGLTPMSQQIYYPIYIINKSMLKISNWSLELLRCFFFLSSSDEA